MAGGIPIPINDDITLYLSTNLFDYLEPIFLIVDVLEWLGVIPDPIQLLMSLFTGRPRDQATSQVVQFLGTKQNAAARLYGIQLGRLLSDDNIVLSSSSPADQKLLSQAYRGFVGSLQAQGLTLARARTVADLAISPTAQAGDANLAILKQAAPSNFSIVGPASIAETYSDAISQGTTQGLTGDKLQTYAFRYTLAHAKLSDLLKTQIIPAPPLSYPMANPPPNWPQNDPTGTTTNPPPSTTQCKPGYTLGPDNLTCWIDDVIPGANQTCPPNYTYNTSLNLCIYTPPAPPPQPGSGTSPGGGSTPGSPGTIPPPTAPTGPTDELGDCCYQTATYLYYVATALQSLATQGGSGQGGNAQCCQNVVNALTLIGNAIQAIPAAIPAPSTGAPVDLTAVQNALTALGGNLAQIDADLVTQGEALSAAITNIGNAIANAPPTDVSGIVTQLADMVAGDDIPQSVIDYLASNGYLSPSDAQIISGAPWPRVILVAIRTWAWNAILWLANWVGITWTGSTWSLNGKGEAMSAIISNFVSSILTAGSAPLLPEITGLIDGVSATLKPTGAVSLGNIGVNPDLLLGKTLAPALLLNLAAGILSYLGWELSESLEKYVDWASALTGLEELKDVLIGSLFP